MITPRGNLWNFIWDINCDRTECWVDQFIIVWDGRHWVPRKFTWEWSTYQAWEWIEIDWINNTISIDNQYDWFSNYVNKEQMKEEIKKEVEAECAEIIKMAQEALAKAEEVAANNPEKVKFINFQMDGDKETVISDDFITDETDVIITWLSGEPNWILEAYVDNWKVTIRSSENENGRVRLRVSKPLN